MFGISFSTVLLFLTIICALWIYTAWISRSFPTLVDKRIILLTAHPDDEAMFFAPTLMALTRPELGNQVKILCLSTGNADGLGELRKRELYKSAQMLGLKGEGSVVILDNINFQDGPHTWDHNTLSQLLVSTLVPKLNTTSKDQEVPALVDIIITFDESGVSKHPNHISCCLGARTFLSELNKGREGWASPVAVYSLTSISLVRKYVGVLDCIVTFMVTVWNLGSIASSSRRRGTATGRALLRQSRIDSQEARLGILVFVSGFGSWISALKAMTGGHWSQMVWFRWGWIGLGRYMIINDLRRINVT